MPDLAKERDSKVEIEPLAAQTAVPRLTMSASLVGLVLRRCRPFSEVETSTCRGQKTDLAQLWLAYIFSLWTLRGTATIGHDMSATTGCSEQDYPLAVAIFREQDVGSGDFMLPKSIQMNNR